MSTEPDEAKMTKFIESAQELDPVIDAGIEGLKELVQLANAAGTVVDDDSVDAEP